MVPQVNRDRPALVSRPVTTSILLIAVLGCNPQARPPAREPRSGDSDDLAADMRMHANRQVSTHGPHGGHLFRLGNGEYYAELTHDQETQTVVVYLLDKAARLPIASNDAEIVLHLLADRNALTVRLASAPQDTDPPDQSSRYYTMDAEASEAMSHSQIVGRLSVTIRGTPYGNAIVHQRHVDLWDATRQ